MADYRFVTHCDALTDEQTNEIHALYVAAGWWDADEPPEPHLGDIIRGSHCFLLAVEAGRIIGMGRAISDRCSDAYIQDVTVAEEYRGKQIGSAIVEGLVERLRADGIGWIGVVAERNTSRFYEKHGFQVMANSTPLLLRGV